MQAIKTGPAWYRVSGTTQIAITLPLHWTGSTLMQGLQMARLLPRTASVCQMARLLPRTASVFTAPDCLSVSAAHAPSTGVETCSVVEYMFSIRTAYEITGSIALYDRLEQIAFNSLPATTDQNFAGNAYYHSINQVNMVGKTGFEINGCCTGVLAC